MICKYNTNVSLSRYVGGTESTLPWSQQSILQYFINIMQALYARIYLSMGKVSQSKEEVLLI